MRGRSFLVVSTSLLLRRAGYCMMDQMKSLGPLPVSGNNRNKDAARRIAPEGKRRIGISLSALALLAVAIEVTCFIDFGLVIPDVLACWLLWHGIELTTSPASADLNLRTVRGIAGAYLGVAVCLLLSRFTGVDFFARRNAECSLILIVLLVVFVGAVVAAALLLRRELAAALRRDSSAIPCGVCGYDLRKSVDRCPECGAAFASESDLPRALDAMAPKVNDQDTKRVSESSAQTENQEAAEK